MPPFTDLLPVYPAIGAGTFPAGENPLSDGGKWRPYSTRPTLQSKSDGSAIYGTEEFIVNGSVYIGRVFTGSTIEAYGCRPESGLGAALESHRIVALYGDPDAYVGYSSGFGGGITEGYFFRRYDGGTGNFLNAGDWGTIIVGDLDPQRPSKLGIRITPSFVEQWGYYTAVGDTTEEWHMVQAVADTAYRGPVWIALETEEQGGTQEVGWTCFYAERHRTQFYRWLPSLKAGELV